MLSGFVNHIKRCWRGEEKLWIVFWGWGVAVSSALVTAMIYLWSYLYPSIHEAFGRYNEFWFGTIYFSIAVCYCLLALFIIWKNSANTSSQFLKTLTRVSVILIGFLGGLLLLLGWFMQQFLTFNHS